MLREGLKGKFGLVIIYNLLVVGWGAHLLLFPEIDTVKVLKAQVSCKSEGSGIVFSVTQDKSLFRSARISGECLEFSSFLKDEFEIEASRRKGIITYFPLSGAVDYRKSYKTQISLMILFFLVCVDIPFANWFFRRHNEV